jgi:hypothetical protein
MRREPNQQADLALRSAGGVPRNPNAVRVAERRLAVVLLELFGSEDVFAVGPGVLRIAVGFVEGVHLERPLHLDRLGIVRGVKHQPPAEAASRTRAGRVQHGVGPHGRQLDRRFQLAVGAVAPRNVLAEVEIERLAADGGRQQGAADENSQFHHGPTPVEAGTTGAPAEFPYGLPYETPV